jgi:UDP-glucose 4-epimerase
VYNLGAGKPQSVNRLVELLGGEKIHIPKRPGEPDCTWADISRIALELGWKPQVSFEEGVAKILANIDYWREAPLWDPASIAKATKTWFEYLSPQGHG